MNQLFGLQHRRSKNLAFISRNDQVLRPRDCIYNILSEALLFHTFHYSNMRHKAYFYMNDILQVLLILQI